MVNKIMILLENYTDDLMDEMDIDIDERIVYYPSLESFKKIVKLFEKLKREGE